MEDRTTDGPPADTGAATVRERAGATASSLVGQVRDKATEALTGQKDALAGQVEALADTVHRSGAQFEGQQDWIAGAIDRAATELGALANSLRTNDVADIAREVRSFARRQPALFVGASLVAGFALARFGKLVAADLSRDDLPALPEVGP